MNQWGQWFYIHPFPPQFVIGNVNGYRLGKVVWRLRGSVVAPDLGSVVPPSRCRPGRVVPGRTSVVCPARRSLRGPDLPDVSQSAGRYWLEQPIETTAASTRIASQTPQPDFVRSWFMETHLQRVKSTSISLIPILRPGKGQVGCRSILAQRNNPDFAHQPYNSRRCNFAFRCRNSPLQAPIDCADACNRTSVAFSTVQDFRVVV